MATVHRSSRAEIDRCDVTPDLNEVDAACEMLAETPQGGPHREDLAPGLRFYPVGNYLVFYVIGEDGITVVRVLHRARDYPHEFQ